MASQLLEAAKNGDVNHLYHLIREDPLLLDSVSVSGADTPLHVASLCGHLTFVRAMLKLKPQFVKELNQDGFTPLHLASAKGHLEIVRELRKVDTEACTRQDGENRIALHCAVVKGRTDVMKELLSACPESIEMKTCRGETVLHLAVKNNQVAAFKLLVEHIKMLNKEQQILNEKDNQGNTALHDAASRKQYQMIRFLLIEDQATKLHMEVNHTNHKGMTPLDVLVLPIQSEAGDIEIHQLLLEAGAKRGKDVPHIDNNQVTQEVVIGTTEEVSIENKKDESSNNQQLVGFDTDGMVMAVLALIATATYQAAITPPGGLWQEDKSEANPPHIYGKSVLATNHRISFFIFVIGNTIGFYSSLNSIIWMLMHRSNHLMLLAMYSISFTYGFSVSSLESDPKLYLAIVVLFTVLTFGTPVFYKLWKSPIVRRPSNPENPNP